MTENKLPGISNTQPFFQEIYITDEHVDRLGHTNNVKYLEWLEGIAWAHIESLGYGWEVMRKSGISMAVTQTHLYYRQASYMDDTLQLTTWIGFNDERFKCKRDFRLIRKSDSMEILTASMEFACIRLSDGRPVKMPNKLSASLNAGRI